MPELIQVFDWLKMPHDMDERFQEWAEANNGSYIRWYPADDWKYPGEELKKAVNDWLLSEGMLIEPDNKYFYVLIYVSW